MGNGGWQVYRKNRVWSDQYLDQIQRILGPILFQIADDETDMTQATDLHVLKAQPVAIACRVRRMNKNFSRFKNEFTIRAERPNGRKTELAKILDGFGDYYFYGWVDEQADRVAYYTVFDIDLFRQAIAADPTLASQTVTNPSDGIKFCAFDFQDFPAAMILESTLPGLSYDDVSDRIYFEDGAA